MFVLKNNPKLLFFGFILRGPCSSFCQSSILCFLREFDNISKQLIISDLKNGFILRGPRFDKYG
jgi:hypothetical protein